MSSLFICLFHTRNIVGCQGVVRLWGLVPVGPTKVKAHNSILFIEGVEDVEDAIPKYHAKIVRDIQSKHLAKPWQSEEAKP